MRIGDFLTEAVGMRDYPYGTNEQHNNKNWLKTGNKNYTFFSMDGFTYIVTYDDRTREFGFSAMEGEGQTDAGDFVGEFTNGASVFAVFSVVLGVMGKAIETFKPDFFKFKPSRPALKRVYSKMVVQPDVMRNLRKMGYRYEGEVRDTFVFKRA